MEDSVKSCNYPETVIEQNDKIEEEINVRPEKPVQYIPY